MYYQHARFSRGTPYPKKQGGNVSTQTGRYKKLEQGSRQTFLKAYDGLMILSPHLTCGSARVRKMDSQTYERKIMYHIKGKTEAGRRRQNSWLLDPIMHILQRPSLQQSTKSMGLRGTPLNPCSSTVSMKRKIR